MRSGAPAHFSITVSNRFNSKYPGRWLDSLDLLLSLQAFRISIHKDSIFLGGQRKSLVYEARVSTSEDLLARIIVAA